MRIDDGADSLAAPTYPEAVTLASIAALERDTDQATVQVKKALSLEPKSAEAHGAQGEVYEAQGLREKAITEYKQASDLAPDDWRWPMSLGVAEFRQGNVQEAIAQLQHAIELDPNGPWGQQAKQGLDMLNQISPGIATSVNAKKKKT